MVPDGKPRRPRREQATKLRAISQTSQQFPNAGAVNFGASFGGARRGSSLVIDHLPLPNWAAQKPSWKIMWSPCIAMLFFMNAASLRPSLRRARLRAPSAAAATSEDLLAEAARLRREANAMESAMEAELAPPPAPAPKPAPKPASVAGVSPAEALDWTGSAFAGAIELAQEDGTTRRTPAEWSPWYGAQRSIIFQRQLSLPLGIILEEAGGGAISRISNAA